MTIGRAKVLLERWRNNLGILNLILLIRITVTTKPIWWGWFAIAFIISVIVLWLDMKYVYPKESATYSQKNPEWQKLIKMVEEIRDTHTHK